MGRLHVGLIFLLWVLIVLSVWPTLFGGFWTLLFKSWFNDRMVWLYEDMKDVCPNANLRGTKTTPSHQCRSCIQERKGSHDEWFCRGGSCFLTPPMS